MKYEKEKIIYKSGNEPGRVISIYNLNIARAAGGRNEETYNEYAEGIRVKQIPSRRQHEQIE